MTKEEIVHHAEDLRHEAARIPSPTMGNYQDVLNQYKRILNDILVLIRELAKP